MTMTGTADAAADAGERRRLLDQLDRTLFVEAGAGTGKTTQLVARIVQLVITGRLTDINRLAAITFTEAAAAELRHRVHEGLERAAARHPTGSVERLRADDALDRLDEAVISTLHSFAARLLADFPVEAGLPPGFEVTDEIAAEVVERERWASFLDDLFADPLVEPVLRRALQLGLTVRHLLDVSRSFAANWDRLDRLAFKDHGPAPVDVGPILAAVDDAIAWAETCGGGAKSVERTLAELPAFRGASPGRGRSRGSARGRPPRGPGAAPDRQGLAARAGRAAQAASSGSGRPSTGSCGSCGSTRSNRSWCA